MVDTLPRAEIVHAMLGRTRLRIADQRGDRVFFASVATGLSTIPGVRKVDVRPFTGSILIHHAASFASIGTAAETSRLFVLTNASSVPPPTPAMPIHPKMVVAAGLGIFALWQLTRGRILPPAITLAWYATRLTGLLLNGDSADDGE